MTSNNALTTFASNCHCLDDFQEFASKMLPNYVFQYIAGGAEDEKSLERNCKAYSKIKLIQRVLRGPIASIDISLTLLGIDLKFPVIVAPTAMLKMSHEGGEIMVAKACEKMGTIFSVSSVSSTSLEDLQKNVPTCPKWFQLYMLKDRELTKELVQNAERSGFKALLVTVDFAISGKREKDLRNVFRYPPGASPVLFHKHFSNNEANKQKWLSISEYVASLYDPNLNWSDIRWLRTITSLPILIKGILSPIDARRAVENGVSGIIISNHGGRQLDGTIATIEAVLPIRRELDRIQSETNRKVPLIVDGGIRRGTSVLKAIALGCDAVMIGRPVPFSLAVGGQEGVERMLQIIKDELEIAMKLTGTKSLQQIHQDRNEIVLLKQYNYSKL